MVYLVCILMQLNYLWYDLKIILFHILVGILLLLNNSAKSLVLNFLKFIFVVKYAPFFKYKVTLVCFVVPRTFMRIVMTYG